MPFISGAERVQKKLVGQHSRTSIEANCLVGFVASVPSGMGLGNYLPFQVHRGHRKEFSEGKSNAAENPLLSSSKRSRYEGRLATVHEAIPTSFLIQRVWSNQSSRSKNEIFLTGARLSI